MLQTIAENVYAPNSDAVPVLKNLRQHLNDLVIAHGTMFVMSTTDQWISKSMSPLRNTCLEYNNIYEIKS